MGVLSKIIIANSIIDFAFLTVFGPVQVKMWFKKTGKPSKNLISALCWCFFTQGLIRFQAALAIGDEEKTHPQTRSWSIRLAIASYAIEASYFLGRLHAGQCDFKDVGPAVVLPSMAIAALLRSTSKIAPALPAPTEEIAPVEARKVSELFQRQRSFYNSGGTRPIAWRIEQIKKLVMAIQQNAAALSKAQAEDGVIPSDLTGAVGMMMGAMGFYCANVGAWSAPDILEDTIGDRSGGIDADWLTVKEPKGVVLNIAPWNAPVLLSALPMLGALAAGNTCIIKPPEACPKTSQLFADLVAEHLSPEAVTVVQGGPAMVGRLIDLGFDHVMFTGGTSIGKIIMARAAKTLTPVTLELGGKNPVMIDEMDDGFLAAAVKEIVGTKMYFSGEFCQCHDYFLVLDSMWDRFTKALGEAVSALGDKRNVRIINKRHFDRCKRMMLEHGGTFLPSAPPVPDEEKLLLPVTAVIEPRPDDFIMQDEAFGPVWSVLRVTSVDAAVARVNASPTGKALVSYYYGQKAESADKWMNATSSGSLAVNAGPMRMQSNFHAGIHGVGNSGLGGASIWGKHVFDTFSHHKHVVKPKGGAFAGSIWGSGPYLGKA